ncbi:MAG: hypothetical protein KKC71_05815 [Chloroflexi bacterium]|nr:hypothetical protein [Chloroflexota bacterium]
MFKRLGIHSDEMALAIAVWLCSLPLVALIVVPFFGLRTAGIVALVMLIVAMAICWGACGWKIVRERR